MQTAKTILQQLGGNRFVAMTGAKQFCGDNDSLQFSLPQRFARRGINKIKIVLNSSDLYNVHFYRLRKADCELLAQVSNVYAEDLAGVIGKQTGLTVSL